MKNKSVSFAEVNSNMTGPNGPTSVADISIRAKTTHMNPEEVIRLEKHSEVKMIEVDHGVAWLTATPATSDVLLRAGDRLALQDNWPYVIQALEAVDIVLFRTSPAEKYSAAKFARCLAEESNEALPFHG